MNWDYIPIGAELHLQPVERSPTTSSRRRWPARCRCSQGMGVNAIRAVRRDPAALGALHLRALRHLHASSTTPSGATASRSTASWNPSVDYSDPRMRAALTADVLAAGGRSTAARPACSCGCSATRTTTACRGARSRSRRCREGERDAARARYLYSLFGEIIRDIKAHDPGVPGGHRQRRRAVHRPHRPGVQGARRPRHQRLPRHLGRATSSRWCRTSSACRSCSPSSAPTPSTRSEMREDQADAGALPDRPVAGDLRAVAPARDAWATPSAASSSSGATAGGSTGRRAASTSTTRTPRGPTAATPRTSSRARTT